MQQGKAISEPCASCLRGRDCVHPTFAALPLPPNTILVTEGRRRAGSTSQEPSQGPEL